MPALCQAFGVRFEYPDNWTLDVSEDSDREGQVVVASPETAFWQLNRYERDADLEALFDEVLAALRTEYHDMEVEAASEVVEDVAIAGYNVNFFLLDLTNTVQLRGFVVGDAAFLSVCQAEDRELDRVAPVFRAMLVSMLRSLKD